MSRRALVSFQKCAFAAALIGTVALSPLAACTQAGGIGGKHPTTRDPSVPTRAPLDRRREPSTTSAAAYRELLRLHHQRQETVQADPRALQTDVDVCRDQCRYSVQICDLQQRICDDADDDPSDENVENCREARSYCESAKRDCTSCSGHTGRVPTCANGDAHPFDIDLHGDSCSSKVRIVTVSTHNPRRRR